MGTLFSIAMTCAMCRYCPLFWRPVLCLWLITLPENKSRFSLHLNMARYSPMLSPKKQVPGTSLEAKVLRSRLDLAVFHISSVFTFISRTSLSWSAKTWSTSSKVVSLLKQYFCHILYVWIGTSRVIFCNWHFSYVEYFGSINHDSWLYKPSRSQRRQLQWKTTSIYSNV